MSHFKLVHIMKKNLPSWIILFLILSSCSDLPYRKVTGSWTINEAQFEEQNLNLYLLVNMIGFKEDGTCNLPLTLNQKKVDRKGTWTLIENNKETYIIIKSSNQIFDGYYELSFEKDYENKLLQMVLKSDKVYLKCSKLLHNFDKNL